MKLRPTQELFAYWNSRRGDRLAPRRSDIEPGAIGRALPDTFILEYDEPAGHPFRLAGTRVCTIFGRELKSARFAALWAPASRDAARALTEVIANESAGVVASVTGDTGKAKTLALELLLLPLTVGVRFPARLLGSLAAVEPPYWLGVEPVTSLVLGGYRHVGPQIDTVATLRLVEPETPGARRPHLVLYQGGLSAEAPTGEGRNG
ncbi:MAG: PAS domain-containing protein [Pseudorhodoplanes sp.]